MSQIDWDWEDIDAAELKGGIDYGTMELPNGDIIRWDTSNGHRMYYIGIQRIYDPFMVDKLSIMAALSIEDVLQVLEGKTDEPN